MRARAGRIVRRPPSALAGLNAVLATFGLLRGLVSRRAGLLAAAFLATTFRFVLAIAAPWHVAMLMIHGRTFVDVAPGYEIGARDEIVAS